MTNSIKCPSCGASNEDIYGHFLVKVGRTIDGSGYGVDMDSSPVWVSPQTEWGCVLCRREWVSKKQRPWPV